MPAAARTLSLYRVSFLPVIPTAHIANTRRVRVARCLVSPAVLPLPLRVACRSAPQPLLKGTIMTAKTTAFPLRVSAADPVGLQEELDAAVGLAQCLALQEGGYGVVVTRHSYTEFTVGFSHQVPYGTTEEREQWQHSPVPRAIGRHSP